MKQYLLRVALASLLAPVSGAVPPAFANDQMPLTAPDFHVQKSGGSSAFGGDPSSVTNTSRATVRVHPKDDAPTLTGGASLDSKPETRPLVGDVNLNRQPGYVTSPPHAGYIVDTPPVTGEAVSQTVPPEQFRLWLTKAHPALLNVAQLSSQSIVDVKGRWDDSSRTLRGLGFPYERVGSGELSDMPLDSTKVMIVDCAGTVPKDAYQRVRDFVARGGYLLSTDWALDNLVERAFPGFIEFDRAKNRRPIYDAYIENPNPVLFANVVSNAHWKMDESSHLCRVLKPASVRVLARSNQLLHEDPASQGVLAVVFPFGKGYVMHMVGHFDNNGFFKFNNSMPDPAPAIGISLRQALAANFVVAGLSGTRIP